MDGHRSCGCESSSASETDSAEQTDSWDEISGSEGDAEVLPQQSLMVNVRRRLDNLQTLHSHTKSDKTVTDTEKSFAEPGTRFSFVSKPGPIGCGLCPVCPFSVWAALLLFMTVLLGSASTSYPLRLATESLIEAALVYIVASRKKCRELLHEAVVKEKEGIYEKALLELRKNLRHTAIGEPMRQVENLRRFIFAEYSLYPLLDFTSEQERERIRRHIFVDLKAWNSSMPSGLDEEINPCVYVTFTTGEVAGVVFQDGRPFVLDAPRSTIAGMLTLSIWQANAVTGERQDLARQVHVAASDLQTSFLRPSESLAQMPRLAMSPLTSLFSWSGHERALGILVQQPITPCGNFSCFHGTVTTYVTQRLLDYECESIFRRLRAREGGDFVYPILPNSTAAFIVSLVSPDAGLESGALISDSSGVDKNYSSHEVKNSSDLLPLLAIDSDSVIISATSKAILKKFGSWRHADLAQERMRNFTFRLSSIRSGDWNSCNTLEASITQDQDCFTVGVHACKINSDTTWLEVVVMPAGSMHYQEGVEASDIDKMVDTGKTWMYYKRDVASTQSLLACAVILVMTVIPVLCLTGLVSRPILRIGKQMKKLKQLDFSQTDHQAETRNKSCIKEVNKLSTSFSDLRRGIEMFSRFVPDTVVKDIVSGGGDSTRLHVEPRIVTTMFSDIRDFTTISEQLTERDLLFVLTAYLTVMTRIAAAYEGSVAEILGDGLLVYWNTPDKVEDHAGKACLAALAMEAAMPVLNEEFAQQGLPDLAIRIGIHTGKVLTGNIGSETKMKFGCLGDPVNLAARLESLCKTYGVRILCSSETRSACSPSQGLEWRELDCVQVKGKSKPTTVHELLGGNGSHVIGLPGNGPHHAPAHLLCLAREYGIALRAYQQAQFTMAEGILQRLVVEFPYDVASALLLARASEHIGHGKELTAADKASWTGVQVLHTK